MIGQDVACPHCQMATTLYDPNQTTVAQPVQSPPKPASKKQREYIIEDRLETIGDAFFNLGIIGVVLSVIAAGFSILDEDLLIGGVFAASALSLYIQGVIIRILFYSISKALRCLVIIATNSMKP